LIGKSKEPEQVQKHMKKCFEGVDSLMLEKKCDGDTYCGTGVKASDGETLAFVTNVAIDGSIEVWLRKVLDEVQLSVKRSSDGCTKGFKSAKKEIFILHTFVWFQIAQKQWISSPQDVFF
jgi:dynein heavy chain